MLLIFGLSVVILIVVVIIVVMIKNQVSES